jgi:transposase
VHITPGSSREQRPDLNQVRLELGVEHHAGIPVLMQPLRGNRSDSKAFGQGSSNHLAQLHPPSSPTYLVADRALSRAEHLHQRAATSLKWIPRVPATLTEAQAVLAHAQPETMLALQEGYRLRSVLSTYGGVAQRWVLISAEPRQPQAQRTVDKPWRKQRESEGQAFKTLCRTAFACEADARQALTSLAAGLQTTVLYDSTVCPTPHSGKRGRPGPGTPPDQISYSITGALASRLTDRRARIAQQSCCILAPNALDAAQLPALAVLDGDKGPASAERGLRFLKAPQFLGSV